MDSASGAWYDMDKSAFGGIFCRFRRNGSGFVFVKNTDISGPHVPSGGEI